MIALALVAVALAAATSPGQVQVQAQAQEPKKAVGAEKKAGQPTNRLARETSPYLLLHAHNPVDWYPWGPEAFAKAKAESKLIFLSVGYSSCFWCHVMERQCFQDEAIAKFLNEHFVCIKVDREERPDIDQIYMAALQEFGSGGWPMSMFLTPDGRPFYGGTYFPPKDREGMPGFPRVIAGVSTAWREERAKVEEAATQLTEIVRRTLRRPSLGLGVAAPLNRALIASGVARLAEEYDPEYGGFGYDPENPRRPKFPEPSNLLFLLDQHQRKQRQDKQTGSSARPNRAAEAAAKQIEPLTMVLNTLDQMARGGIRDQLAGGYHRYSVRRDWVVPHFEKMLYDNAQLASVLIQAFEITGDPRWRAEAESTLRFIERSMTAPEGGFYSALDAETRGEEGEYYVWSEKEIREVLGEGPQSEAFLQVYGLKRTPNFEKDRFVLTEVRSREAQAESLETTPEILEGWLQPRRAKLLARRERREAPLRDDKILTAWNGLAIAAFADASRVFQSPRYRAVAEKAADFLLKKLTDEQGGLLRTYRSGIAKLPAYLEDYAFLAHGLLRLHAATSDGKHLDAARKLTDQMINRFTDKDDGGFFYTADDHESLITRPKDPFDNVLPSGNSLAIRNLLALHRLTGQERYLDSAGKALSAFSAIMSRAPQTTPYMLIGLEEFLTAQPLVAVLDAGQKPENPANAQEPKQDGQPNAAVKGPNEVLVVTPAPPKEPVPAGSEAIVTLKLNVKKGWHIYANPTGTENARPTVLSLEPSSKHTLGAIEYPPGESKILEASGVEPVALWENSVTLTAKVKLSAREASAAADGTIVVPFRLRYQACNDVACMAPTTLTIPVAISVAR